MEDLVWKRTAQLASVVRDFAPSRPERQLLAQAFEVAWNRSRTIEPKSGTGPARANGRVKWVSIDRKVVPSRALRGDQGDCTKSHAPVRSWSR
jgi:hypothetical protein